MSKSYFFTAAKISLVLLIICAAVSGIVSFVYSATIDAYNLNLENEQRLAISGIFAASDSDIIDYVSVSEISDEVNAVYLVIKNGQPAGYCVNITGSGFGGDMGLMIGYSSDGSIMGVQVISHAETPGVGTKALESSHLSQYAGKSGELTISKSSTSDVVAVSGATISSKAVHTAINSANSVIREIISNSMSFTGGIE